MYDNDPITAELGGNVSLILENTSMVINTCTSLLIVYGI